MTRGEDWNKLEHLKSFTFIQSSSYHEILDQCSQTNGCTGLSIWQILISHMKRQNIWTHSLWESISVPTSREQSTINWKSTVNLELEVLTLIPVTSPSAAKLPRVSWRSWSNGTRKPRLWQKAEMQSWGQQTSLSQFNWWFPNNWEHTPSFLVLKMGPRLTTHCLPFDSETTAAQKYPEPPGGSVMPTNLK